MSNVDGRPPQLLGTATGHEAGVMHCIYSLYARYVEIFAHMSFFVSFQCFSPSCPLNSLTTARLAYSVIAALGLCFLRVFLEMRVEWLRKRRSPSVSPSSQMVACPICDQPVKESFINIHIDSECRDHIDEGAPSSATQPNASRPQTTKAASFFTPAAKRTVSFKDEGLGSSPFTSTQILSARPPPSTAPAPVIGIKRPAEQQEERPTSKDGNDEPVKPTPKKQKNSHAPLAERMRPQTLDDVAGQELVGPDGVLRNLIVTDRVPSMVLWGGPGTGKTTIARLIAQTAGTRFVEINSTSSGVAECKKLFAEAKNELGLTGRKTIIFCDEIHRFSKSQQDVFLGPVEAGQVTLIGATTEK